MAQPLSKTKEDDGTLYTRPPPIEAAIDIAIHQDLQTLCQRARIRDRNDPHHLSSECLVHLTRRAIRTDDGTAYNALQGCGNLVEPPVGPAKNGLIGEAHPPPAPTPSRLLQHRLLHHPAFQRYEAEL
jgi:hypothetical protein